MFADDEPAMMIRRDDNDGRCTRKAADEGHVEERVTSNHEAIGGGGAGEVEAKAVKSEAEERRWVDRATQTDL